ncbi:MAG: O-antigen ligase family protein, partial [Chloroflexi bacterium]|nr:O-antigen ligase family protein [Chloroflexota bacterium]
GKATPLLDAFDRRLTSGPRAFPGHSPEIDRLWLSLNGNRGLAIWGTDVWLGIKAGEGRGTLTVRSEGLRSTDLFRILQSHAQGNIAHIDLDALADVPAGEGRALTWISVAEGLAPGEHLLHVEGGAEQIAAVRALRVGHRPEPWALVRTQLLGVLALILLGARARREAQLVPWRHAWQSIHRKWSAVPVAAQGLLLIGAAGGAFLAPVPTLRLAALTAYGLLALLGADIALLMAVASIPLAPLHVRLGPGSFSVTEVALLIAVAARVGASLLDGRDTGDRRWAKARLGWPDIAVLALVVLGLGTSLLAEYRRVALREFRVVVLESALLYLLVRRSRLSRSSLMALIDALWLSAVVVALYALVGYALGFGVIAAEGVNRARAFYGSPNNLALYLERVLPLGPVLAWRADARRRRWLYGLGTLPMASALMLTFSRGSCLLGLPAALLVLILFQGGKWRWLAPLGLMGGLAALIPLSRTERFASLFDLSRGTLSLRIKLWQAACDMVRDHPWLGVGLDNFLYYYGDYIRPGAEIERWLSHPHNLLLDFWLRLGIGGVIVLLALLAGFWASALKLYRGSASAERRAACLGLMAGMAACLAHGLIDSSYFVTELAHWFLFALAWVGRAGDEK